MKQSVVLGKKFSYTNIVKITDMLNGQLLRVLDAVQPDAIFENEAIAVVEETLEKRGGGRLRPVSFLKGVLLSKKLWAETVAANPGTEYSYTVKPVLDDFLLPIDRMTLMLQAIAPTQNMESFVKEIPFDGVVHLDVAFDEITVYSSIPTLALDGNVGELIYDTMLAGEIATIRVVTQPHYAVIEIARTPAQANRQHLDVPTVDQEPWGYLISPALANLLGVSVPTI